MFCRDTFVIGLRLTLPHILSMDFCRKNMHFSGNFELLSNLFDFFSSTLRGIFIGNYFESVKKRWQFKIYDTLKQIAQLSIYKEC